MRLPTPPRQLRVIGFDDAPFARRAGSEVRLVGAVCAGTRFEGMVVGRLRRDGWNATDAVAETLLGGKFLPQLHLVLLDGIAFGGLNVVDLPALAGRLGRPCVAVMRRPPNLEAMHAAMRKLPGFARRERVLAKAGPVHAAPPFWFQVAGADAEPIAGALARLTDRGHVPEALRLAHLIGSAWMTGQSSNRA
jgi:endonuclease V-like protein UPF0215 family